MNLVNILYEPMVIVIIFSIVITIITYFILKSANEKKEDAYNIPKTLLYTFIISLFVLIILRYILAYMNTYHVFQKGGGLGLSDRLTIIADDVDIGLIDS
jgi:TRAP-type C4-dicarboxylate transport system permease small subunit